MTDPDSLFRWRMALLDSATTPSQRLVGLVVSLHVERDGARASPSVEAIASQAGLSRRSVHRALAVLKHQGWISVEQQPGRPSGYRIRFPKEELWMTC